jgi:hypothetical protein
LYKWFIIIRLNNDFDRCKHSLEHVQVIRSNIGSESVEKCRDVQNEPIWANFRKKAKGIPLDTFFKTSLYFLETEYKIFKTFYKYYTLTILESIQIICFYISMSIKYSSFNCISKNQKNQILSNITLWIYGNKRWSFYH